jgi:predicted ArsR family transcriptional regulator
MIFKRRFLDGILAGEISVAFRKWIRPTVKAGGTLRTAVGVLAIDEVARIEESDITEKSARAAGYASREELLADLASGRPGWLYRVDVRYAGADPRIALRDRADLTSDELSALRERLKRMDAASRTGAWAAATLRLLAANPEVRAGDLALRLGQDTAAFKRNVRKLKNLGLTESLEIGYRLSPRGRALLEGLDS